MVYQFYCMAWYYSQTQCPDIFSSPEPLAHYELLWWLGVRRHSSTIASKDISSLTTGCILTKLGINDPCNWQQLAGPRSSVGRVSDLRCVSDCRSRGCEIDPGPVPYFCGDRSRNNFYGHSPPFHWFIQEGLLSVTIESMCTNYWLTACSSLPRKKSG